MMRILAVLCWSCLFASFTSAYLLHRQVDTVRGAANSFWRSFAIKTADSPLGEHFRDIAYSSLRGPPKGTAQGKSIASASSFIHGTANSTGFYTSQIKAGTNASAIQHDNKSDLPEPIAPSNKSSKPYGTGNYGAQPTVLKQKDPKEYLKPTAEALTCPFAIQDVVSIRYWAHYQTQIYSTLVNITSTVTKVTKHIDTTIINLVTIKTQSTSTGTTTFEIGINRLTASNSAQGPSQDIKSLSGSTFTTLGITITSPQPFFIYNSITLINEPAITQHNGKYACATNSTKTYLWRDGRVCKTEVFTNINSNVANYWTNTDKAHGSFKILDLDAPFVYQPDWGTTSDYGYPASVYTVPGLHGPIVPEYFPRRANPRHGRGYSDYGYEDFGYVPQALIDFLSSRSGPSSDFLRSVSLLPGGPMIARNDPDICKAYSPVFASAVSNVIDTAEETFDGPGCFSPGGCVSEDPAGDSEEDLIEEALMKEVLKKDTPPPDRRRAVITLAADTFPQPSASPAQLNPTLPVAKTQATYK